MKNTGIPRYTVYEEKIPLKRWGSPPQETCHSMRPTEVVVDTEQGTIRAGGEEDGRDQASEFQLIGDVVIQSTRIPIDGIDSHLHTALRAEAMFDVGMILEQRRVEAHAMELPSQECMICLEEMVDGHVVSSLPCAHTFHYECVSRWLNSKLQAGVSGKCPSCNLQIVVPAETVASTRRHFDRRTSRQPVPEWTDSEGTRGSSSCSCVRLGPQFRCLSITLSVVLIIIMLRTISHFART